MGLFKRMFGGHNDSKVPENSRKEASVTIQQKANDPLERELTCPFCMKVFPVKELVFAIETDDPQVQNDSVYERFVSNNFLFSGTRGVHRRLFAQSWSKEQVVSKEAAGNDIPLQIKTVFSVQSTVSLVGADPTDYGFDDAQPTAETTAAANVEDANMEMISEYRLCPKCHCELPKGIGCYQQIRIGLYGGPRSGKSTYMVLATECMKAKLPELNLASVGIEAESSYVLKFLSESVKNPDGLAATATGRPSFPIMMLITPFDSHYSPFFLIFQDIAGEYATNQAKALINHPFAKSNCFLGIVDVNMLRPTDDMREWQRKDREKRKIQASIHEKEKQMEETLKGNQSAEEIRECEREKESLMEELERVNKELERRGNKICTLMYHAVFSQFSFSNNLEGLKNVQLCLCKIDRWLNSTPVQGDEEGKKALDQLKHCTEITQDHMRDHENGINVRHLEMTNRQIHALLGNGVRTQLEIAAAELNASDKPMAYTAIASVVDTPMNLLDPVLNICRWEKLLPKKKATESDA